MESGKRSRSVSIDKKVLERTKTSNTSKSLADKRKKSSISEGFPVRDRYGKISMIPVLKCEKIDLKYINRKTRQSPEPSPSHPSSPVPPKSPCPCKCSNKRDKKDDEYELRLKILEEKEKCIAEYYLKIEETLRQLVIQRDQKQNDEPDREKPPPNTCARKMTSDPAVFNSSKTHVQNNILSDFENNVEQISSIWLRTSADLYKTLRNLKRNPSLDPMEFEVENVRIQLAIKQAKSLTLVKTKSVIAEAKKLYHHGEMIRSELAKLLSGENVKMGNRIEKEGQEKMEEVHQAVSLDSFGKNMGNGTGDRTTGKEFEKIRELTDAEELDKRIRKEGEQDDEPVKDSKDGESDEISGKHITPTRYGSVQADTVTEEVEVLATELARKNETITSLNNRIFELQKACNEHLLKYNQLQVKLSEFYEKIQWNQVLWKQIGKLKDRIQGLQQSNKQLEANKKELELKITKLDKELERLIKLNHLLNQRKYLSCCHECQAKECKLRDNAGREKCIRNEECDDKYEERILSSKQNAINQLKSVLSAMKIQENFAQKQIAMCQSKIDDLEKKN